VIDSWLSNTKIKNAVDGFVKKLFDSRISANQFTILGLIFGLFSAFLIFLSGIMISTLELMIISSIIMIIAFFFDIFDGAVARNQEPTIFGGILDIFCDRIVEVFIIIALISTNSTLLTWPGIFTLMSIILCITMFLVVGGSIKVEDLEETEKVIYYRKGLMERSETFIFLLLINILFFWYWRFILLWLFASLIFLTAFLRLRDAYIIFKVKEKAKKELV